MRILDRKSSIRFSSFQALRLLEQLVGMPKEGHNGLKFVAFSDFWESVFKAI